MANNKTVDIRTTWILVGTTATGKTDVSNELAHRTHSIILSADSMLVYKGMDIGTAKPPKDELAKIKFFGIDLVEPEQTFSVGAWLREAKQAFEQAERENRSVITTGGTGLYINALITGIDAPPATDSALRETLNNLFAAQGVGALIEYAESIKADSTKTLNDAQNPRRIIRLIEKLHSENQENDCKQIDTSRQYVIAGLASESEALYARIRTRVEKMFASGLLDEVDFLRKKYSSFSETAGKGIGYEEAIDVLDGKMSVSEAINAISVRTRQFAKRQRTWFRNKLNVEWIDAPKDKNDIIRAADEVMAIWEKHGKTPIKI